MGYLTKSLFCALLFISFFITNGHSQPWYATEKLTDSHDPTVIRDERGVYTSMTTNNLLEHPQKLKGEVLIISWEVLTNQQETMFK